MTQDELWNKHYEEVSLFIKENGRNISKYNLEERRLYTWLKHNRKALNAGKMKEPRLGMFNKLLCLMEAYRHKNQYA